jgi:hypothetical protein
MRNVCAWHQAPDTANQRLGLLVVLVLVLTALSIAAHAVVVVAGVGNQVEECTEAASGRCALGRGCHFPGVEENSE